MSVGFNLPLTESQPQGRVRLTPRQSLEVPRDAIVHGDQAKAILSSQTLQASQELNDSPKKTVEIQEANTEIVVINPLYGNTKLANLAFHRSPKISFQNWVKLIHVYLLAEIKKCKEPINVVAVLKKLSDGAELPTVCLLTSKKIRRICQVRKSDHLAAFVPSLEKIYQTRSLNPKAFDDCFGTFENRYLVAELVLKKLHALAHPIACSHMRWDERHPNSLPTDAFNEAPQPLKFTHFVDIMRSVLTHQKVGLIGSGTLLNLSNFKDPENVEQQVSFLKMYAGVLRERHYFSCPQSIDFQIEQIRLLFEISGNKWRNKTKEKFEQLANMKLSQLKACDQNQIKPFVELLGEYKELVDSRIDIKDENQEQKRCDKLKRLNELLQRIFSEHPIPLLKALIPFNIGSYNNFYNLFTKQIGLPTKLNQRDGLVVHIPAVEEINALIPQTIRIFSKDNSHEIGWANFDMELRSQGHNWQGALSITEACIAPSATDEEKVQFIEAFAGSA